MPNVGVWEMLILVLVLLLVFGPKRIPEVGRMLGRGMREFKETVGDTRRELKESVSETERELKRSAGIMGADEESEPAPPAAAQPAEAQTAAEVTQQQEGERLSS